MENLNNVGSIKTNDGKCAREIAWQKRGKKAKENAHVNSFNYKWLFLYCTQENTTGGGGRDFISYHICNFFFYDQELTRRPTNEIS